MSMYLMKTMRLRFSPFTRRGPKPILQQVMPIEELAERQNRRHPDWQIADQARKRCIDAGLPIRGASRSSVARHWKANALPYWKNLRREELDRKVEESVEEVESSMLLTPFSRDGP